MSPVEDTATIAWLAELQGRFSAVLRTPLDRTRGTLRAMPDRYDAQMCHELSSDAAGSARERLAVYNRQYWFRLFGALQNEFRLSARLLSYWTFNDYALRFLLAHPPQTGDLADCAEGFEDFLAQALPAAGVRAHDVGELLPKAALCEAAQLDAAFRRVFRAPPESPIALSGISAAQLAHAQLSPAAGLVIFEEHWPLVRLRQQLSIDAGESALALPSPHEDAQYWAIFRTLPGHGVLLLAPLQAQLLQLMGTHPVAKALALLEASASAKEQERLAHDAQRWLAESVRFGFWTGLELAPK